MVKSGETLYLFLSLELVLLFKKEQKQKIQGFVYTAAICTGYKRKRPAETDIMDYWKARGLDILNLYASELGPRGD